MNVERFLKLNYDPMMVAVLEMHKNQLQAMNIQIGDEMKTVQVTEVTVGEEPEGKFTMIKFFVIDEISHC